MYACSAPYNPPEPRHPAFAPARNTPEWKEYQQARLAARQEAKKAEFRGPIMTVAQEEAKTALALVLANTGDGLLDVPDISQAHRAIYTRIEQAWVDACGGEYLVVQSKLAVLKLLCHVCGVDAALKASKQKLTNKVNSDDAIEHMKKLGVVKTAEPAECEMPRRSVDLAGDPPVSEKPPSGR